MKYHENMYFNSQKPIGSVETNDEWEPGVVIVTFVNNNPPYNGWRQYSFGIQELFDLIQKAQEPNQSDEATGEIVFSQNATFNPEVEFQGCVTTNRFNDEKAVLMFKNLGGIHGGGWCEITVDVQDLFELLYAKATPG